MAATGSDAIERDIVHVVQDLVHGLGTAKPAYGGLEITVQVEAGFPWAEIFHALQGIGHDVWIKQRGGALIISSKPPAM